MNTAVAWIIGASPIILVVLGMLGILAYFCPAADPLRAVIMSLIVLRAGLRLGVQLLWEAGHEWWKRLPGAIAQDRRALWLGEE